MVDWSLLPKDLLQSIAKLLDSHFDFLRFRRVCTTWRSSAPLSLRPPPIFCSRVDIPTHDSKFKHVLWKRTFFLFKFPADLSRKTPKFWFVRLDEDEFGKQRLFHPLYWGKLVTVEYPLVLNTSKVHVQELCPQYLKLADITGDGPNCVCLVAYVDVSLRVDDRFTFMGKDENVITFEQNDTVSGGEEDLRILIFRKFGSEEWSRVEVEGFSKCVDFVQFEGKCYATDRWGNTICVDPFSRTSFLMAEEFAVDPFAGYESMSKQEFQEAAEEYSVRGRCRYLVESCGNILLIEIERTRRNVHSGSLTSAFKLEVNQLDEERKRWDPVESLGDAIVFVGSYCKLSIPAIPGVEGNCIVFVFRESFSEETFFFHLSSKMIVPLDHRPDLLQLFSPPCF